MFKETFGQWLSIQGYDGLIGVESHKVSALRRKFKEHQMKVAITCLINQHFPKLLFPARDIAEGMVSAFKFKQLPQNILIRHVLSTGYRHQVGNRSVLFTSLGVREETWVESKKLTSHWRETEYFEFIGSED